MNESGRNYSDGAQLFLSKLFRIVTISGLIIIAAGFALYTSGLAPATNPVDEVTRHWHLSADEYAEVTGHPAGWSCLSCIGSGDVIGLIALVFIPGGVIICLGIMVFIFLKEKDPYFAVILAAEVVVLLLAAGGIVS